jgi:choline monooxygenase
LPLIDPDIRKAETLPSRFYTDSATFEQVRSGFSGNWHFAAHLSQLEEFNIIPLQHLEGLLREPLLLTKGEHTRCISNVCTHRGMLVANEPCKTSVLQCPYHGRTFGLDGSFRNMPEFEQVEGFPSAADDLTEFPLAEWRGLLFSTLDGTDCERWLAPLAERIGWMPVADFKHDPTRDREYEIDANWALYVDNYLEGFHIPFVHGDLHDVLDYDGYRTELFDGGVLQVGRAREGEPCFELPESSPDYGENVAAYYYWLFPGLMLNFYPWGLSVNVVVPISVERTKIVYHGYVWDSSKLGQGAGGDLDKVEAEDQFVVEATQRGVNSRAYERGRYSPTRETGVHHFHRLLTRPDDSN